MAFCPPCAHPLACSASVFLARFHGEIVAAKEIDIGMSQLNRDVRRASGTVGQALQRRRASPTPPGPPPPRNPLARPGRQLRVAAADLAHDHPHPTPPSALLQTFIQEAVSLHALRHQNVVAFYGLSIAGKKGVVLCEYCEGEGRTGWAGQAGCRALLQAPLAPRPR